MKTKVTNNSKTLQDCILAQSSIYIYGTGTIARETANILMARKACVKGFLDHRANLPGCLDGIPVTSSPSTAIPEHIRENATVLIGIFNHQVDLTSLRKELVQMRWGSVLTFNQYHEAFYHEFGDRYWLTHTEFYNESEPAMRALRSVWSDEKSKTLHDKIALYRKNRDCEMLDDPEPASQYFPSDVPGWPSALDFVDCGAYNGDTLQRIHEMKVSLRSYVGFEPDIANFKVLVSAVKDATKQFNCHAVALPCGTYNETCQLRFEAMKGAGSMLSPQGESFVQCVAIDDVVHGFSVNVLKMDVEGAEMKSLLGAERTIRTHNPSLAICLYHHPAHIWEIPLLIQEWNLGYEFFLRSHGYNAFDLVMYAVPRKGGR